MIAMMKLKKVRKCCSTNNSYEHFRIDARVLRFNHRRKALVAQPVGMQLSVDQSSFLKPVLVPSIVLVSEV